ncbi:MAG: helix-turn-helix transcriptional regulator [Actinomycetota bacterium]
MHPLERLVNLVALLLEARRPLPFEEIRRLLPAYDQTNDATAKRQFERDKDDLRQIGVPLEVVPTDAFEVEDGYRIRKERYELPEVAFTPEEVAALWVASHGPAQDAAAARAFSKLALGADAGLLASLIQAPPTGGVDASGPHLRALADAASRRRRVKFRYRPLRGRMAQRDVDAWTLVFRRGAWYLVGRDRRRGEPRSFRLSRIASQVEDAGEGEAPPEGFVAAEQLAAGPWGLGEPEITARVAFSPKVAWWALAGVPGAQVVRTRRGGWTEAEVPATTGEAFAAWVLSFGPDAEVLAPKGVRDAVVATVEAALGSL